MKKLLNNFSFKLIFIALLLSTSLSYSQLDGMGGPGGFDDNVNDEAPITSLLIVGLIAGSIYGIKKIKR